jgi:uncharacterized membrane protein
VPLDLHPPLSSFPIALITVAAMLEFAGAVLNRKILSQTAGICLRIGGVFLIAAFITGNLASEHANQTFTVPDEAIASHYNMGRLLLFCTVPCIALEIFSKRATHGRVGFVIAYRVVLAFIAALVLYTGHLGGELVFEHGAAVKARLQEVD